ncbi:carboxypeptidase-like regulatory domain-containing protein [Hymenobacter sp. BT175]|uniref:carboxypeptidase-like regulatory domain-containing protein n=1 Tax=Hymenobacter translucens TaxID=2886507 RepID=UPI001D0DEE2E|nr:carboxypeptidase-like regulatory domain-containing protein [Hymenobacter translucens]MCC2548041.1 carboxypeptidase-like regulatory domain-containing protein [Hymenobacter translucens]
MFTFRTLASFAAATALLLTSLTSVASTGGAAATASATTKTVVATKRPAMARKTGKRTVKFTALKPLKVVPTTDIFSDHRPVTLTGWVTGADGMPLSGATVWITNGVQKQVSVTDAKGDFVMSLPNNATISLTVGYAGYENRTVVLTQPRKQNGVSISLESEKQ